jgi:hypothetical protein
LEFLKKCKKYLGDTIAGGLNLIINETNNLYHYYSVSEKNTINFENKFNLPIEVNLTGIKTINDNLIILYGSFTDNLNKTTYAYIGKYYPLNNTFQDTILYSRKNLTHIEKISSNMILAIGESRGFQGFLIIDMELNQLKDIRIIGLFNNLESLMFIDKRIYLFTSTFVRLLSLPDDIIANVEDSPKIFVDKFTHSAYPNPASDVINLKVSSVSNDKCSIKLYDLLGVEIQTIYDGIIPAGAERNFSIQSNNLAPGAYYYVIRNGSSFGSGQINVMR